MQGIETEPADGADIAVLFLGVHLHDLAVFAARDHAASRAAGGTDSVLFRKVPLAAVLPAIALHNGIHRTGVYA